MTSIDAGPPDAAFYFDLGSPECYLAAERVLQVLPTPLEWQPVLERDLGRERGAADQGGTSERNEPALAERARELGLQELRMPDRYPFDSRAAMRAATYAKSIGRTVAFCQAAFRQAFAGGHDLGEIEYVLIAGAACEMHPTAILRAIEMETVGGQLATATAHAAALGVSELPAVRIAGGLFVGEDCLDAAAAHVAASRGGVLASVNHETVDELGALAQ